jgi:hypothetical protein
LIATLANLMAHVFKRNVFAEMLESFLPRLRVQVNRINERPIDIKDDSLNHFPP